MTGTTLIREDKGTEVDSYTGSEVTFTHQIWHHTLNVPETSMYFGKVFQTEKWFRNSQLVNSCDYGADSDYARQRVAA